MAVVCRHRLAWIVFLLVLAGLCLFMWMPEQAPTEAIDERRAVQCQPALAVAWDKVPRRPDDQPMQLMIHLPKHVRPLSASPSCLAKVEQHNGIPYHQDERQRRSQTSHEIWAWERLKTYPYLTLDPEAADMIYVPIQPVFGVELCRLQKGGACGLAVGAYKGEYCPTSTERIAFAMRRDELLRRYADKVFFLHGGFQIQFDWGLICPHNLIATHVPFDFVRQQNAPRIGRDVDQLISIPQQINAYVRASYKCDILAKPRPISIYFSGSERPFGGSIRRKLNNLHWGEIPGSLFFLTLLDGNHTYAEKTVIAKDFVNLQSSIEARDKGESYAAAMLSSRFCIIASGDNAASRRMWDALATGCVPVILSNRWEQTGPENNSEILYLVKGLPLPWHCFACSCCIYRWVDRLPFAADIDWTQISVVINTTLPPAALLRKFKQLVAGRVDERLRSRIQALREEFIWGWGDPIGVQPRRFGRATDNMLLEVARGLARLRELQPKGSGAGQAWMHC